MSGAVLDGFWLPRALREEVLNRATWQVVRLRGGVLSDDLDAAPDGVRVRWPTLPVSEWAALLRRLQAERKVAGDEAASRWQAALALALGRLRDEMPARLPTLAAATGYTAEMLAAALARGDLVDPSSLVAALGNPPTWTAARRWVTHPRLGGRLRFFPRDLVGRLRGAVPYDGALFHPAPPSDLTLGFAAGNVPGTALLMVLLGALANHVARGGVRAPATLVRNSRHEPLFTPWVLTAVEEADPELVASTAVMVWDYDDPTLQAFFLARAGLMIAAADDTTIAALDTLRRRCRPELRFHRHGHKVSFAVLARDWAARPEAARLAALDSSFWDQNGCLSARIHFVEGDAFAYAEALTAEMSALAETLPRGATPRRFTRRAYDTYATLAASGAVRVLSGYDDGFAVVLDGRRWDPFLLRRTVNVCQGRTVVVRPVRDAMHVSRMLREVPAENLQSVSVLLDEGRLETLAEALGSCGVTALRGLGRGAFPQLGWSWDGLLPADVCCLRRPGRFTTIEPSAIESHD